MKISVKSLKEKMYKYIWSWLLEVKHFRAIKFKMSGKFGQFLNILSSILVEWRQWGWSEKGERGCVTPANIVKPQRALIKHYVDPNISHYDTHIRISSLVDDIFAYKLRFTDIWFDDQ